MTAFYISRVMFMTFHGEPRADEETMHHAHESPWVMLIPLIVLAIGAAFFGWLGYDYFVGDGSAGFWKSAILVLPGHDALARAEDIPLVIGYLPLVLRHRRHRHGLCLLYRRSAAAGCGWPQRSARSICSC